MESKISGYPGKGVKRGRGWGDCVSHDQAERISELEEELVRLKEVLRGIATYDLSMQIRVRQALGEDE